MAAVQVCTLLEVSVPSAACRKTPILRLGHSRYLTLNITKRGGAPSPISTQMLTTQIK